MTDRRITIQINADGTAAVRNIRDVTDETRRMGDQTEAAGRRVGAAFRSMAGQIGLAIGGGAIAKAYLDANIAADRLAASLTAVTGSASAAGREMAYVTDVANRLGLDVSSAASAYVSLSAAAKGTTLEGARARDIFEAVSLAMAKLGKSSADTEGALLAIEQMISKGKVSAEELRGQLGERLPGAFQAAAAAMGVTTEELDKLLSTGNITADDLLPKLASRLNDLYDDGQQIQGLTGEWNRMTTAFRGLAVAIDDATGLTGTLEIALREAGQFIDNIRWAVDYLDKGVNPDKLAGALSAGAFGYENLREEADRLYSLILEKQEAIYTLSEKVGQSEGRALAARQSALKGAQDELLSLAQRLGDVKIALAEMDQQQDQTWARQKAAIDDAEESVGKLDASMQVYAERAANLLTRQGDSASRVASEIGKILPVVDEMSKKYGVAREVILGVIAQESNFDRLAESTAGALGYMQVMPDTAREIEQSLGMAAGTVDKSWNANIEAGTYYLSQMIEKFGSLEKALHAYNAGPGNALKGILPKETQQYIPAVMANIERLIPLLGKGSGALKLFGDSGQDAGKKISAGLDPAAAAISRAVDQAEQLARQYIPGRAAAMKYAEAQSVLAVAVAKGTLSQAQATEILEKMRAEMAKSAPEAERVASTWTKVWETTVQRIDDAFANLWVDLFEGTSDTLETLKRMMLRWLAEVAHMLTTQRLTVAIGAAIGLPGYAAAGAQGAAGASGAASGSGFSGLMSGIGGWFGGNSMGASLGLGMGQSSFLNWVPTSGITNLMATPNWAMGLGGIGGMLAGSLLGNGSTASRLGTGIGSAAGSVIGSMILPVPGIGTVLGGILGGGGGGFLGGLFGGDKKKKPNPWAAIDVGAGEVRLLNSQDMELSALRNAVQTVNSELNAIAEALGDTAVQWKRSSSQLSGYLTTSEQVESHLKNIAQWQIEGMLNAVRQSEVQKAGGKILGRIMQAVFADAGSDPQSVVAASQTAKTIYKNFLVSLDRLFIFSEKSALFSSIDQSASAVLDLALSMKVAGESTADALDQVLQSFGNFNITNKLNPSLLNLTLSQTDIENIVKDRFSSLDQNVAAAQSALALALAGRLELAPYTWSRQVNYMDYSNEGWAQAKTRTERYTIMVNQQVIDQAEVAAARQRLADAQRLSDITARVLSEEEIQAEIMRRRIEIMERLATLVGGQQNLAELQNRYYVEAFTETERAQNQAQYALGKIADFNQYARSAGYYGSYIDSIAGLRAYIENLNLVYHAHQDAYVKALQSVEYFTMLQDALEMLNPAIKEVSIAIQDVLRKSAQWRGVSEFEKNLRFKDIPGADKLASLHSAYYESAYSESERAIMMADFAIGKIQEFNSAIGRSGNASIGSIKDLRSYVDSLNLIYDAHQEFYLQALGAVEYFTMLQDALETLNPAIKEAFNAIQAALRQTEQARGVSEFERAMALRDLTRYAAQNTLPRQAELTRTLDILSRVTDEDFTSAAERDLAAAKQYAALLQLERIGNAILNPEDAQLDYLRRTAESAERQSTSLESIDRAVNSGRSLVMADDGPSAQVIQSESTAALAEEVRQLRADLAQLTVAQMLPMRDLRDIFQRWEIDGLPPTREDEDTQTIAVLQVA